MNIHSIDTGLFKLDGGAMFGVVPKSLWQKLNPPDEQNLCTWAMRCLLIEDEDRLILVDNGIGNKQDDSFLKHYYLHGDDSLDKSLEKLGVKKEDISDVLLTHLHFDHCGGSVQWNKDRTGYEMSFPNARYWSHEDHWKWATEPNPREKASFLKENIMPIQEQGHLNFMKEGEKFSEHIELIYCSGHTEHMMLPLISYKDQKILFCADLIPSADHLGLAWVMAYDTRPLLSMSEKEAVLKRAIDEKWILCFEHDAQVECASLKMTEKGIKIEERLKISDL